MTLSARVGVRGGAAAVTGDGGDRFQRPARGLWARIPAVVVLAALASLPCLAGEGQFATASDGARIHFLTMGAGVPVVFIAGGPGNSCDRLRRTHTLLKDCGRLVFMDNRGRGQSTAPDSGPAAYTLENDLLDVEAVRVALGAERIVVFGHSYGSMVAMGYAARHPQHTLALITTGGVHGAKSWQQRNIDGVKRFLQLQYPDRWSRIVKLHRQGKRSGKGELAGLFRNIDELYFYRPDDESGSGQPTDDASVLDTHPFNSNVYHAMIGSDPEWTLDGTLRSVELLPELTKFKGPALIMGGRFDRICPPINQHEIAAALPNARLVIFEHSGHDPAIEEPLGFLNVVSGFLQEVANGHGE